MTDKNENIPIGTIRAICRVVADHYRQSGTDPKTISSADAWSWYVNMVTDTAKRTGVWSQYTKAEHDFLQLDGPGGTEFRVQWKLMTRDMLIEASDLWLPGRN